MSVLKRKLENIDKTKTKSYKPIEFFESNMIASKLENKLSDYFIYPYRDKSGYIVVIYYGQLPEVGDIEDNLGIKFDKVSFTELEEIRNGW
jgi:hypothetical protein